VNGPGHCQKLLLSVVRCYRRLSLAWGFRHSGTKKSLKMWSSDMIPWYLDVIMAQLMQSWDFREYTSVFVAVRDVARLTEISTKHSGTVSSCIILYMWLMDVSIRHTAIIDTSLTAVFVITILFSWYYCGAFLFFRRWSFVVVRYLYFCFFSLTYWYHNTVKEDHNIDVSYVLTSPLLDHVPSLEGLRSIITPEVKDMFRP